MRRTNGLALAFFIAVFAAGAAAGVVAGGCSASGAINVRCAIGWPTISA
jgi:hypothetical protein